MTYYMHVYLYAYPAIQRNAHICVLSDASRNPVLWERVVARIHTNTFRWDTRARWFNDNDGSDDDANSACKTSPL